MGRLESVQEASNASLPRSKEEEERSKRSKEEEGRWKSEEWERSIQFSRILIQFSISGTRLS